MVNTQAKHEAFRRLAEKRTNAVLEKLRILGHCANPQLYEYAEEDVKKIFRAIDTEIKTVRAKFTNKKSVDFRL